MARGNRPVGNFVVNQAPSAAPDADERPGVSLDERMRAMEERGSKLDPRRALGTFGGGPVVGYLTPKQALTRGALIGAGIGALTLNPASIIGFGAYGAAAGGAAWLISRARIRLAERRAQKAVEDRAYLTALRANAIRSLEEAAARGEDPDTAPIDIEIYEEAEAVMRRQVRQVEREKLGPTGRMRLHMDRLSDGLDRILDSSPGITRWRSVRGIPEAHLDSSAKSQRYLAREKKRDAREQRIEGFADGMEAALAEQMKIFTSAARRAASGSVGRDA